MAAAKSDTGNTAKRQTMQKTSSREALGGVETND